MIRRLLVLTVLVAVALAGVVAFVLEDWTQGPSPDPAVVSPTATPVPPTSAPPAPSASASRQPTASAPTLAPCSTKSRGRLSVVTMNLHFGRARDGRLDLRAVARELEEWDADVVLLQEVDRGRFRSDRVDQARRLGRLLGMEAALGLNRRVPPGASGNAILSRYPLVASRNASLPGRPGEIPRGLLRATIDVAGERIDVFVTHLESSSPRTRAEQSRVVVGRVLRSPRPVVLGGDLNSRPDRSPVRRVARAGLVDAWVASGGGDGFTVPAGSPRRRIDYVFADESFRVRDAEVLLSLVSDHRPVRAELALLPQRCR